MVEPLGDRLAGYFHFHGLRGALLQELGRTAEARSAFDRAIALANSPAEAAHIRTHLDRLLQDGDAGARAAKSRRRMPPPVGRRGPRSS
jgi:RNA polymerase sigma-70 factor (ECF subfamily)